MDRQQNSGKVGKQEMSGIAKYHVGDKYGSLTLIEDTGQRTNSGGVIWKCQCECGNIVHRQQDMIHQSLVKGCVISCGCKRDKSIGQREKDNKIRIEKAREGLGMIDGTTMVGIGEQKIRKNNSSGVRGVSYDGKRGYWRARLMLKRTEYSGQFKTKEEAIAYRKYLEEVYYEPVKEKYEQMRKESE